MQQRDEQIANLQLQINQAEAINAGALAAAQEAANNAQQALNVQANGNFVNQHKELSKMFSFVPSFNGNPLKIFSFVKAVENTLSHIENFNNDLVVQAIKSKIDVDILETSPSETWEEIKQCIILHCGDKRDEVALIRDLHKLQCSTNIEEFYDNVEKNLMLLLNRARLVEPNAALSTKAALYQDMALKVFIGGIKGITGSVVRSQNPKNLKEALLLYNEDKNCTQGHSSQQFSPQIPIKTKPTQYVKQQQIPFYQL